MVDDAPLHFGVERAVEMLGEHLDESLAGQIVHDEAPTVAGMAMQGTAGVASAVVGRWRMGTDTHSTAARTVTAAIIQPAAWMPCSLLTTPPASANGRNA